ncbi:rod-binding protein [Azospirillum sp.]|uniref:rod-binding protein n=1 Tax=Azospirillum sp. TaxID=34012 RepID=UPI002D668FC9|nr:rod-binding protein [Azospirillum sp.]HYD66620.1 rod-binding protein [Azospirillum sp.]
MNVTPATSAIPAPIRPQAPDPAKRAAKDFEAMIVGRMLESMFAGVQSGGPFGGGQAEQTWRGFMLQEYGKAIAEAGTLGIGRMVESEVARLYAQQSETQG